MPMMFAIHYPLLSRNCTSVRAQDEIESKYTSEMCLVIFVDVLAAISFVLLH